jgi:NitT/TauT family transport system permease protein
VSLVGFGLTIVIGCAVAIAMSQAKWIERSLYPYAVLLQTLPIAAVIPAIGLALGYNFKSRVFVSILLGLFPIITNTLFGLLSAERGMHDLFTLHNVSRWTRLWKLQIPAAMPAIFTGLRIAAGLSVIGAVLGDMFFQQGDPGIGTLIVLYNTNLQLTTMYGAIIIASVLGLAYFLLVGEAQRRVVGRWHEATRGGS